MPWLNPFTTVRPIERHIVTVTPIERHITTARPIEKHITMVTFILSQLNSKRDVVAIGAIEKHGVTEEELDKERGTMTPPGLLVHAAHGRHSHTAH